MTTGLFFRLIFVLCLSLGLNSAPLLAQEEEEKPEETEQADQPERPQRGEGGQRGQGGRGGQRGGPDLSNLTEEERRQRLNQIIQERIITMAEAAQIRPEQEKDFIKTQAKFEFAMLTVQTQMRAAGQDRDKRRQLRQGMQKARSDLNKSMKKILDKEQFASFEEKLKERMPQRGGGRQR